MEQQPIRILRRPCPIQPETNETSQRPPVVTKTLEQREADYAAARRRIMGSATPEPIDGSSGDSADTCPELQTDQEFNLTRQLKRSSSLSSNLADQVTTAVSNITNGFSLGQNPSVLRSAKVHATQSSRQSMVMVNVGSKNLDQSLVSKTSGRQGSQQQRLLSSVSSSSFFSNSSRTSQHSSLLSFQVGYGNAGLLPTPPSLNYSLQNTSNMGFHNSHSAALALMQNFNLLHQQYQQAFNGFQNQLVSSGIHGSLNFAPSNFSSSFSPSNGNPKFTHPSAFN